jgi:hypothetical protein
VGTSGERRKVCSFSVSKLETLYAFSSRLTGNNEQWHEEEIVFHICNR